MSAMTVGVAFLKKIFFDSSLATRAKEQDYE